MLVIPQGYREYRLVSIDPGLTKCGVSIYRLSQDKEILSIDAFTLQNERVSQATFFDDETTSDRALRLERLRRALCGVLEHYKPAIVAHETPFYNRFRPMAFGALVEVVDAIKYAVYEVTPFSIITGVEPMLVKKAVNASKGKGKDPVKEGVRGTPSIMSRLAVDLDTLDEHSIDAVAVGYATLLYRGERYV